MILNVKVTREPSGKQTAFIRSIIRIMGAVAVISFSAYCASIIYIVTL